MSAIDHNEIYLQPTCCVNEDVGRLWCEDPDPEDCEDGKHWTRYVRSDIHESTIAQLEALRQERDGLRADAVRYRWLRHGDNDELVCVPWMLRNEKLDAAIDAAMAKEQCDGA